MRKLMILLAAAAACLSLRGQEFQNIPSRWKWISDKEVVFSTSPTYADSATFSVTVPSYRITKGVHAPDKYSQFPIRPQGAVNLTYSPDSTKLAFTRDNDLYVADCATGAETRLTYDGSDVILNGYASWVYYEEILGRPSMYKAFWWSPDSKKIGFYRFDNSKVPMFPIYSPRGQDGTLKQTRYPKAGETNPEVKIGMIDLDRHSNIVWADFDPKEDQYFGIPFWGPDSKDFYIAREPRVQNTIDLYAVSVVDGSKKSIYHEEYPTWLNWFEGIIFTDRGL
ncbi:MAG: DPP IV N-terminal domain-containing protein [Bacteroidales bacterium]|nr:DPP IV N-terminal domain-containing protein [Bacteroidales bacterium]